MSSINGTNIERMRVNGNEIALAKINGKVVFQKNKLLKTFFGDSKQNTTSGKNLLFLTNRSGTLNGLTYNWEGTKLTLNGTTTTATDIYNFGSWGDTEQNEKRLLTAGTYTLNITGDNARYKFSLNLYYGTTVIMYTTRMNEPKLTRELTTDKYYSNCYVSIPDGITFNNETFYFQLEKNSTSTEYEPYTGGKPSPNPDYPQTIKSITGASLKLTGKNLFNINKYVEDDSDYYSLQNDNLICEVIDSRTQGFVYTKFEKGTYTVSTTNVCNISIHEENSNYLFLQKQNINQFTFTLEEDKNLHFKFFNDNVPYNIGKVQIEKGSQVTTYEPYKNQIIPINLQNNILAKVGDYVDELQVYLNGDVKIVKKIGKTILNNTANYTKSTYSTDEYFRGYLNGEETLNFAEYKKVMNTHFQSGEYNQTSQGEMLANRRQLHIQILASRLSENSVTGLQEWLGNNNVTALRPLANSITRKVDNIKEELNSFGDYSNIEIETTYN